MQRHITPAFVIACIALFVSLGSGAYAVRQTTGREIRNGSITSADIKNKSLRPVDFRPGVLPAYHFSLTPRTVAAGTSASVGAERGFSFRLTCSWEQGDSWDGNGLELLLHLYGTGATGEKLIVTANPAYPSNAVNMQQGLAPKWTVHTSSHDFRVVGEEADAQGEVRLTTDADAGTCRLDSGIVKIR